VDDITDGVVAALDRPLGYEVINLGRGEPVRLGDFVAHMEALAGGKARLRPAPKLAADVVRTYADIGKARSLLGYSPRISVEEGVARFWEWYRKEG
jgi:UDP-glucuronate 4-epimerase